MYDEIQCPYCNHSYDLCHDDGAFYNGEDESEQEECPKCGKTYLVWSSQSWSFEGAKADCLNDAEHDWQKQTGYPEAYYHGRYRCSMCHDEERRDEKGRQEALQKYSDSLKK